MCVHAFVNYILVMQGGNTRTRRIGIELCCPKNIFICHQPNNLCSATVWHINERNKPVRTFRFSDKSRLGLVTSLSYLHSRNTTADLPASLTNKNKTTGVRNRGQSILNKVILCGRSSATSIICVKLTH